MAKRSQYKDYVPAAAAVALAVLLLAVVLLSRFSAGEDAGEPSASTKSADTTTSTAATVKLPQIDVPVSLDGKLEIESLFPYDGINPDCGNQEGKSIAAIVLRNTSDTYLDQADIEMTLTDGSVVRFQVEDLPAGKSVMAFSAENGQLKDGVGCADMTHTVVYDTTVTQTDLVSVSTDGMSVAVTNVSGKKLTNIDVYCHNSLDGDYFGGTTYMYTIENLAAGEIATIFALDCILGMVEVVRVTADQ